ncbi:MAG: hypothetical protein JWQ09_5251, partial [Segetibacter sp.]|nr:hypothetical protein [Segetibacter sp.]
DFAGIRVYPNPTKDAIRIQVSYAQLGSGYSITAETGKRVIAGQLNNRTTTINIKSLAAGIYFVQVGGLRNNTFKVVKQ